MGDFLEEFAWLIGIMAAVAFVFLFLREIWCWYWKINLHIEKQDKIIKLLELLNSNLVKTNSNLIKINSNLVLTSSQPLGKKQPDTVKGKDPIEDDAKYCALVLKKLKEELITLPQDSYKAREIKSKIDKMESHIKKLITELKNNEKE
jgi:hypothetical protein